MRTWWQVHVRLTPKDSLETGTSDLYPGKSCHGDLAQGSSRDRLQAGPHTQGSELSLFCPSPLIVPLSSTSWSGREPGLL